MKKFLALLLALVMSLSLVACGGGKTEEKPAEPEKPAETQEPAADPAAEVKVGLICVHDENSGYDAAHIEGLKTACGEGWLEVLEMQAPNAKRMSAKAYLQGKKIEIGTKFN